MLKAQHEPVPRQALGPDTAASAAGTFLPLVRLPTKTTINSHTVIDSDMCVKNRTRCIENPEGLSHLCKKVKAHPGG